MKGVLCRVAWYYPSADCKEFFHHCASAHIKVRLLSICDSIKSDSTTRSRWPSGMEGGEAGDGRREGG